MTIEQAAEQLGVATSTLRRWEREGKIKPKRTPGGHRRYSMNDLYPHLKRERQTDKITIAYARVSSRDQKKDLERQRELLELYCASNGWKYEVIEDLGSGLNYQKKGLRKLLSRILAGEVGRLVLTHKDRLLRFGAELVFAICEDKQVEVVIINQGDEPNFEEELAKDVQEIITVFSAKLYGARSHKNRRLLEGMKKAVNNAADAQD